MNCANHPIMLGITGRKGGGTPFAALNIKPVVEARMSTELDRANLPATQLPIITRKEALALGLKRYFTGEPCPKGHVDERLLSSYQCCECARMSAARYHVANREKKLAEFALYRVKNRSKMLAYLAEYRRKPENIEARKKWWRDRYDNDPVFAAAKRARSLISEGLRRAGVKKNSKTEQILGCSLPEFQRHIERQFQRGMSWDNKGDWEVDHIIPIASASSIEDVFALNHYTNLRPLWRKANRLKSASRVHLL